MARSRPNFLIPGAGKAGTNSIRSYLNEHPEVYFCRAKEPNFFAHDYSRGEAWYERLFTRAGDAIATGEASTHYFWYPEAPERIKAYNPGMRLIFSLRNPVLRAYSDYTAKLSRAGERRTFREIIGSDKTLFAHSRYHTNLKRYFDTFPREQMHIIRFDDFVADRYAVLRGICAFLEVGQDFKFSPELRRENRSEMPVFPALQRFRMRFAANMQDPPALFWAKAFTRRGIDIANHLVTIRPVPRISEGDYAYVANLLADEISGLEELLGWDLSSWRAPDRQNREGQPS